MKKESKYGRLYSQIKSLIDKSSNNPWSNMATLIAVLHNKMPYFFWTGFYLLQQDKLQVGPYQGSLACINLAKDTGVCWAGINGGKSVIVDNVEEYPGHIACDGRTKSEVVVPLKNAKGEIVGVLDVDSRELNSFDEADVKGLEKIISLVYTH
ncbi:MAG: GAF domain-containing protein [Chlorobi bacterium]|nr:GAF domain-containing protein [Chlorobiota bacterium]